MKKKPPVKRKAVPSNSISSTGKKSKTFPIVAIGASAGGLEALKEILQNLSPETGMAYIYIQHLDPSHESMLANILSKATKMPVVEAREKMKVEPNQLYIIPPNKDMTFNDGRLILNPRPPKPELHMPINSFFNSLAENQKEGTIAIILSGNANDGSSGLKAIKISGGITMAQDETAKFQSMPRSAVAEGAVDLVLSPKDIASELIRLGKQGNTLYKAMVEANEVFEEEDGENHLNQILELLKKSTGVDFNHYKKNTIRRRIVRRMLLYKLNTLEDYAQYLRQHTNELHVLYQDLLIHVTCFFRDPDSMEYMKKNILPKIIKQKSSSDPLRIWIPACSTGEEAYSIAMILMELLGDRASRIPIQIFATDLSEIAIAKARMGIYSKTEVSEISPHRLTRFFTKLDGSFRISKGIRDLCVFAPHNIFKDPPFSRIDVISCCNLLIYLDLVLQKKLMSIFHYALNKNGYLILGKSESIGTASNWFVSLDKKHRIYQKKKDSNSRGIFEMTYRIPELSRDRYQAIPGSIKDAKKETSRQPQPDIEKTVDKLLLNRFVPASVLVNNELEILQFRGSTGAFLEPASGRASLNLLKMAKPGLAFELRNAIHKVQRIHEPFRKNGIEIKQDSKSTRIIDIEIVPLKTENDDEHYLIVFRENELPPEIQSNLGNRDKRVKQLESELYTAREDMRSIIEEQEAVNEELQSANEEIVSSNEELQSINEELETSKEEVESTNEELMTINQELQMRNDQLGEAYDYAETVFATIRESLVVLDSSLRVKNANRTFYRTFKTTEEETEGRLIFDLLNRNWNIPRLRELLEELLPNTQQVMGFEITHNFSDLGEKSLMLNARKLSQRVHKQELILLAMEDITEYVAAQRIIAAREKTFREMADNAPVLIWTSDIAGNRIFFNKTWLEFTGRKLEEESGMGWLENIFPEDREALMKTYNNALGSNISYRQEYRLKRFDGSYRWMLSIGKPIFDSQKNFTGLIGTVTEIHDQRMMNAELEKRVQDRTFALNEMNINLERSNKDLEQFAYVSSHDLQEPLRKISVFSNLLLKKFGPELPPQAVEYTELILGSSERMAHQIHDLLQFSQADKSQENFSEVDLNLVLEDILKDFDLKIRETNAVIILDKLPVIHAAPIQMNQLFRNLISNAFKFSDKNRVPEIKITGHNPSRETLKKWQLNGKVNYVEIIVSDNGIGFEEEYSDQIFEIFQRLHTREQHPGSGIGLALCRKIVSNHNGIIHVHSVPAKGSDFHILLPV